MIEERIKGILKPIIEEAYTTGYKKCLTDIIERCDFIYSVIAEKAEQDIKDTYGIIDIPEVVLCGDCKHHEEDVNFCKLHEKGTDIFDFCSYAEKGEAIND